MPRGILISSGIQLERCRVITGAGNTHLANQSWETLGTSSWLVEIHHLNLKLTPWNLLKMTRFWRSLSKNTTLYVTVLYTEEREEHLSPKNENAVICSPSYFCELNCKLKKSYLLNIFPFDRKAHANLHLTST